jgi:hypothetical protein
MIRWVDKDEWSAKRHLACIDNDDEKICVHAPDEWENEDATDILNWWAVSDSDGIFVYTNEEATADLLQDHFTQTAVHETMEQHAARATGGYTNG